MRRETLGPHSFWGKLSPRSAEWSEWHPLVDHCLDVAWVARALLDLPLWQARLARLGLPSDTPEGRQALALVVGLHDLGKFSPGFQKARTGAKPESHVKAGLQVVAETASREPPKLVRQLQLLVVDVVPEHAWEWLTAAVCHHGRPGEPGHAQKTWCPDAGNLDILAEVRRLLDELRASFPAAKRGWPTPGRVSEASQHAICGLTVLSDWIGSNTTWFPYRTSEAEDRAALAREAAHQALRELGLDGTRGSTDPVFRDLFPTFQPFGLQAAVGHLPLPTEPSVTVFEASTGSGKTEAALHWFARLHSAGLVDGLYFALPMRTAAVQLHARVASAIQTYLGDGAPGTVLAVPGYYQVDDWVGKRLDRYDVQWENLAEPGRVWAAESPMKYLAAPVAVGTVDQVLLGALQTKWAHFRATCTLRQLLVVDEVHASDTYMARLLLEVIRRQLDAGGHVLLLSATLGSRLRDRLLQAHALSATMKTEPLPRAEARPYPCIWTSDGRQVTERPVHRGAVEDKVVTVESARSDDAVAVATELACRAVRAGARVLVIRNTVREAVALMESLEAELPVDALLSVNGVVAPHHSRYAASDRKALDDALLERLAKTPSRADRVPVVAVATQTAEQSLDLDADLLITDLCPMDVLLQRIGRLHRHHAERAAGFEAPRCIVLCPTGSMAEAHESGRHAIGTVYDDLAVLEATRRLIEDKPRWSLPSDNRMLVERATHPDMLAQVSTESEALSEARLRKLGASSAERQAADRSRWTFSTPFLHPFPRVAPKTRLGDEAVRCELSEPIASPFTNESIWSLNVPRWMLPDEVPDEPRLEVHGESLVEPASRRIFRYGRLGLREAEL